MVPDSCCKTVLTGCGQRDHASNIYKVEVGAWAPWCRADQPGAPPRRWGGRTRPPSAPLSLPAQGGCITKLETFIQEHLRIIGAVGIGIACVQVRRGAGSPRGAGDAGRRCPAHLGSVPQLFGMAFTCCLYKSLKLEHY